MGRAIREPKILILDEPTEGILPNIIDQIGEAIKLLRRGGHPNEAGLLAGMSQSLKNLRADDEGAKSPLVDEAAESVTAMLRDGVEKQPAALETLTANIDKLRHQQPTGLILGEEIGAALKQLRAEGEICILLVEQYLDFCRELADIFAIMDRGVVVARGSVAALTDEVVRLHLTV